MVCLEGATWLLNLQLVNPLHCIVCQLYQRDLSTTIKHPFYNPAQHNF